MPNLNKTMLIGHLTRDPEQRFVSSGNSVVNIGLAMNETYKDSNGEKKESRCFVDVELWGKVGDVVHKYVKKGDPLYVEGSLKLDEWEDKDGNKRSKLKVRGYAIQFLGGKKDTDRLSHSASSAHDDGEVSLDDSDVPF